MDFDFTTETITPDNSLVINIGNTGAFQVPAGTTAQRPTASAGAIRYNSSLSVLELYSGSTWATLSSGGTVTSVGLSLPSIFSVTGSPVTSSGTLSATLATQSINTVLAGPTIGSPATPTFRTLGLATNDMNDVLITSATNGQVLVYNGSYWVNNNATSSSATGYIGVSNSGGGTAWTLVSGNIYTANFVHNLGTENVVISVYNTTDNSMVVPHYVTTASNSTVTIQVYGNTTTLRVVVIANGLSMAANSSIIVQDSGSTVASSATTINFVGNTATATAVGNVATLSVGNRFTFFASSLDSPNSSDYVVNNLAPIISDPTYPSITVRAFGTTAEQGVGFMASIPSFCTMVTVTIRGRAQTAPGSASVVLPKLYTRLMPTNAAMGSWSSANLLTNISIPTNAYFQTSTVTYNLSTLGITPGNLYQFELTRAISGITGTNLASNFYMTELTVEFG